MRRANVGTATSFDPEMNNTSVTIIIAGEPVALARPRFHNVKTRSGREFVSTYQPAHSRKYQTHVRMAAQQVMDGRDPLEGPLALVAIIAVPIPKSFSKRRHGQALVGGLRPTTRPDCSNLLKNAEDGMNGIVYHDDNQIVELHVTKLYSDKPQMKLMVTPLQPAAQTPMPLFGEPS
jgi:Holliday junction resolvase RusA-like endonuclease